VITRGFTVLSSLSLGLTGGSITANLRLIETTDLHLHLLPWDYYTDQPRAGFGLAAAAELIEAARSEVPNALLFDNGDFLQGTPLGDVVARSGGLAPGSAHPAIAAMNALGYDAINLGNHEFNYGLDFLLRSLADADCPVLSANLALRQGSGPRSDRLLVKPYALLDRNVVDTRGDVHPIRIGVLGLAPPQVVDWDRHLLEGRIFARDIVETAHAWVPEMREAGADVVLVLAHTGIGPARHSAGMENAAIPLARVPGIDAMMIGHNHLLFPAPAFSGWPEIDPIAGTIAGTPAVMGGCFGAQIGLIDLLLTRDGGCWQVLGARSEVRSVAQQAARTTSVPPVARPTAPSAPAPARGAAQVTAAVAEAHRDTLAEIRRPIGVCTQSLHTYFVHLGATEALSIVADAQSAHVRARLHDPGLAALPVLSSVAPFKCGGLGGPCGYTDIPPGRLALRHVADLYSFPNAIAALRVTGAEVIEWLERAGAVYNRIAPGSTGTLLRNAAAAGYQFEVIEPLDVLYDLTAPSRYDGSGKLIDPGARRVIWALYEGTPIDPEAEFILCTNSYRLGGAGGYAMPDAQRVVLRETTMIRDILRNHIAGQNMTRPRPGGGLRFAPIPGTTALFETGPGALPHLREIADFAPETRGTSHAGFLRLKIDMSGTAD